MNKPKFTCKIINGKMTLDDREGFQQYIKALKSGFYNLTIDRFRKSRTTGQDWEKSKPIS